MSKQIFKNQANLLQIWIARITFRDTKSHGFFSPQVVVDLRSRPLREEAKYLPKAGAQALFALSTSGGFQADLA